jgi:hypothetical protein
MLHACHAVIVTLEKHQTCETGAYCNGSFYVHAHVCTYMHQVINTFWNLNPHHDPAEGRLMHQYLDRLVQLLNYLTDAGMGFSPGPRGHGFPVQ